MVIPPVITLTSGARSWARDAGEWFIANGGLQRANGESLRRKVLSRGRSLDPQAMFIDFYGGPPEVAPLVAYRGL